MPGVNKLLGWGSSQKCFFGAHFDLSQRTAEEHVELWCVLPAQAFLMSHGEQDQGMEQAPGRSIALDTSDTMVKRAVRGVSLRRT